MLSKTFIAIFTIYMYSKISRVKRNIEQIYHLWYATYPENFKLLQLAQANIFNFLSIHSPVPSI